MRRDVIDWVLEEDPFIWLENELRKKERDAIPEDWFERELGEDAIVIIPPIWFENTRGGRTKRGRRRW